MQEILGTFQQLTEAKPDTRTPDNSTDHEPLEHFESKVNFLI